MKENISWNNEQITIGNLFACVGIICGIVFCFFDARTGEIKSEIEDILATVLIVVIIYLGRSFSLRNLKLLIGCLDVNRPQLESNKKIQFIGRYFFIRFDEVIKNTIQSIFEHQTIFDQTIVGIARISFDGRCEWHNRAFLKLLNLSEDQIFDLNLISLIHRDDFGRSLEILNKMKRGDLQSFTTSLRFKRFRREDAWIRITLNLRYDARGKPQSIVALCYDISERQFVKNLFDRQQERIIEKSRVSEFIEMASNIAHEINNPMMIVSSNAELLRDLAIDGTVTFAEVVRIAEQIQKMAFRITKIVQSLHSFAQGNEDEPMQKVEIRAIIEETIEICRERFSKNSTQLKVTVPNEIIEVECRSIQISQVLLNILNNAFDAIESLNERWVHLEVKSCDRELEISITDSGHGVPVELREKILKPFFSNKPVGHGIGLSLSKRIVESHEGSLILDSDYPNTRFLIRIPKQQSNRTI